MKARLLQVDGKGNQIQAQAQVLGTGIRNDAVNGIDTGVSRIMQEK